MTKIEFKEITNYQEWDEKVLSLPNYSFLNSSARYKYLNDSGSNTFRFFIYQDGSFVGIVAGNIGHSKIFGKFLECKHSPLVQNSSKELWAEIMSFCKALGCKNGCFMVRLAPLVREDSALSDICMSERAIVAPIHNVDALISQYFDMTKSEEDLRHDMTDSTRNNINKLSKNPDISVKVFDDNSQFEIFKNFHIVE